MLLSLLLLGCPKPPEPPPVETCNADASWITNPSMPGEVQTEESFCNFYQFSWQWFLAQTSPSTVKGERLFETNRVYDPQVKEDQCGIEALQGKDAMIAQLEPRLIKPSQFENVEADGGALYNQDGNILYYGVYYADASCMATSEGFKEGTLEIKTAWSILPESSEGFYTMETEIEEKKITLGLVGIHLAIWTPNHPEMIWVTWEHKSNAPLCNGTSPKQSWNLSSKEAALCLEVEKGQNKPEDYPEQCEGFNYNKSAPFSGNVPLKGQPNNVCRKYAYGNEYGPAINGNDTNKNLEAIQQLNASLVGAQGLLTKLDKENPMSIWSNYEMVGGLWTKDGAESGSAPVATKASTGNPDSPQRGSLELTNMSMETFQQGSDSYIPNCFGCHNYVKSSPLTVSHIQSQLLPQSEGE